MAFYDFRRRRGTDPFTAGPQRSPAGGNQEHRDRVEGYEVPQGGEVPLPAFFFLLYAQKTPLSPFKRMGLYA